MTVQDKIEREIVINAPLQRVWELVSEPGWWIGDGDRSAQRRWKEGDIDIIEDPKYGRFPLQTVVAEPPSYVSFRWVADGEGKNGPQGTSTLVEFWVSERGDGTVVRVVESGFASLPNAARAIQDNKQGWAFQMDVLKTNAERVAA